MVWASTELCTFPDVEPDEEPATEADKFVDEVGSVDDVLAADSDDELEVDDESDDELEESDDELEELVSVGSASATAGVFATAAPKPRATANTPTRTMYCAFTGISLFLAVRVPTNDSPSHFFSGLLNRVIVVPVEIIADIVFAVAASGKSPFCIDRGGSGAAMDTCADPFTNDLELVFWGSRPGPTGGSRCPKVLPHPVRRLNAVLTLAGRKHPPVAITTTPATAWTERFRPDVTSWLGRSCR